jgi:DNA-binding response OmpR family regulator
MGRVLVVDDDPAMSALIELRLVRGGNSVVVANSAHDAMTLATTGQAPEVVVLDVAMPDMSGFDLLKQLRSVEQLAALPAVFLSARVTPSDIEAGIELGAIYLTKPFVATALLSAVDRLIHDAAAAECVQLEVRIADGSHSEEPMVLSDKERLALERLNDGHDPAQALRARAVLAFASSHSGSSN